MSGDDWKKALRGSTPPPPPEGHRERLEDALLERYDAKHARPRPPHPWLRVAAPLVVLLSIVTAARVPAEYQVEVGKRVSFTLPPSAAVPQRFGERLTSLLREERGRVLDIQVRALRQPEGETRVMVEVWGDRLAPADVVTERITSLPGLKGVAVEVVPLNGRVRDSLLHKLGHQLFDLGTSAEERAAARERLIAELRAQEGPEAEIDVQLGEDGKVRARVRRQVVLTPDAGAP